MYSIMMHSAEGNAAFSLTNFEEALRYYTEALAVLKSVEAPRDPIILLNRSAAYIGLKRCRKFLMHHADAIAINDDCHCLCAHNVSSCYHSHRISFIISFNSCMMQICPCTK